MSIIEESVVLVFIDNEVDKNVVYEEIEKSGIICNIEELKPLQLVKKLKQICNLYKVIFFSSNTLRAVLPTRPVAPTIASLYFFSFIG